jgi:hypothetical protein
MLPAAAAAVLAGFLSPSTTLRTKACACTTQLLLLLNMRSLSYNAT